MCEPRVMPDARLAQNPRVTSERGRRPLLARWTKLPQAFLHDRDYCAVNVIAGLTVIYIVAERVWFTQMAPIFPRAGAVGDVLADTGIGYISAWILVYLITWRPMYVTRQNAAKVVARQIYRLYANASQLRGVLRDAADESGTGPLTREELSRICANVHFRDASNLTSIGRPTEHASVLRAIANYVDASLRAVPRVVDILPYFESEVVLRVAAIQTSDLVSIVESLADAEAVISEGLDLTIIEENLSQHFQECDELWDWMCENYRGAAATVGPTVLQDRLDYPQFDLG